MKSPKSKLAHGGSECGPMAGSGNKSNVKYVKTDCQPMAAIEVQPVKPARWPQADPYRDERFILGSFSCPK